jgi:hypothetical protein
VNTRVGSEASARSSANSFAESSTFRPPIVTSRETGSTRSSPNFSTPSPPRPCEHLNTAAIPRRQLLIMERLADVVVGAFGALPYFTFDIWLTATHSGMAPISGFVGRFRIGPAVSEDWWLLLAVRNALKGQVLGADQGAGVRRDPARNPARWDLGLGGWGLGPQTQHLGAILQIAPGRGCDRRCVRGAGTSHVPLRRGPLGPLRGISPQRKEARSRTRTDDPFLPWTAEGVTRVHWRSLAGTIVLQNGRFACVTGARACPAEVALMYPSRTLASRRHERTESAYSAASGPKGRSSFSL